jgi:RNA recognition motif-containing protein
MTTLFISGFPLQTDEIELVKLFLPFGEVNTIKIVRDKKTGKCKGYAFIVMHDQYKAEEAANNLNGTDLEGRQITVKIKEEEKTAVPQSIAPTPEVIREIKQVKAYSPAPQLKKKRPRRSSIN